MRSLSVVSVVSVGQWYRLHHLLCPTERTERTENFILYHAEPFRHFCHFCGTMILLAPSFMSHENNGKNGNFYFAPYGAFPSFPLFLWDYYYHRMFFMSHENNGKNGNFYFAPYGAFPSFPLFLWDYYYHRMFFMSHGNNGKNRNFLFCSMRSLSVISFISVGLLLSS